MTGPAERPLLTLGRVQRLRVQVGYRARPDGPAYQQFLLDLPVPGADEARVLAALEPVLYIGSAAPRHYSLHQHRWHTSWGMCPGVLELGLLVTTGTRTTATSDAALESVTRAFHDLLAMAGPSEQAPTSRDAAIQRARTAAATAYGLDPDTLSLSAEQHHPAANSWTVGLRSTAGDEYDVQVGVVDGYPGSVRVSHDVRTEVSDSVGSE